MRQYRQEIDHFVDYFESQLDRIESVEDRTFRKLLYATAMDPLARAAFGKIGNRTGIVRLIEQLTSWSAKRLVSLPQLALLLKEAKRSRYRLCREVSARLRHWPPGHLVSVSNSPVVDELLPFASPEEHKLLMQCIYPQLFYTYRNNLVHEFREPGYGFEAAHDGDNAFYTSMIDAPWQLVFPVGFFATTCRDAMNHLRIYLTNNKINPYANFQFGSLWRGT